MRSSFYDQVLTLQPDNAEALAYRGWLLYQTGDADLLSEGKQLIASAVAADPKYPDAHFFFGSVNARTATSAARCTIGARLSRPRPARWCHAGRAPVRRSGAHATRPPRRACTGRGCYNRVVTIRIGGGQGFYGDGLGPVPRCARSGRRATSCARRSQS